MTDRVHAFLDGELPREALNSEERARLASLERAIEPVAETLRSAAAPDLTARVMGAIGSPAPPVPEPGSLQRLLAWLWSPRPIELSFRPAYGFAGVAMAVLSLMLLPLPQAEPVATAAVAATAEAPRLYVQFRLEAPGAERVELAGSFTGWEPGISLHESTPGVWSALVPLDPGVHDYTFVIDGQEWVVDPGAPSVQDGFGGSNSRLFLPAPAGQA